MHPNLYTIPGSLVQGIWSRLSAFEEMKVRKSLLFLMDNINIMAISTTNVCIMHIQCDIVVELKRVQ